MVEPTIEASADPMNPDYMGSTTVTWKVTGEHSFFTVELNGEKISDNPSSSLELNQITYAQRFVFTSSLEDGEKVVKFLIVNPKDQIIIEKPIITISPDVTIVKGDTTVFSWNIIDGDSVWSNISAINSFSGSIAISPEENLIVIINSSNKGGVSSCSSIITVTEPVPPPIPNPFLDILRAGNGKWNILKMRFYSNPDTYDELNFIGTCMEDDFYFFGLEYLEKNVGLVFCEGQTHQFFRWDYSVTDSILTGLGNPRKILSITDSAFFWEYKSSGFDENGLEFVVIVTEFFVKAP